MTDQIKIPQSSVEFLAYHGTSLISRAIQFQTWAGINPPGVSHIAIRHGDGSVTEAWQGSVQHVESYKTLHKKGTKVDVYKYINPPSILHTCMANLWLVKQVGKPYDYMGIVHFMDRHDINDAGKWFCSKLAMAYSEKLSCPVFNPATTPEYKVTPVMFTYSPMLCHTDTIVV